MKSILYETIHSKGYISEYQLLKEIKANNVILERLHLYEDFIVNLIYYIQTTYLGKEYIHKKEDIDGHFNWAFNKVVEEFEEERISFRENNELKTYLFDYFSKELYFNDKELSTKSMLKHWNKLFKLSADKDVVEFKTLLSVYQIFDNSFK
jgi:hypothetical protein